MLAAFDFLRAIDRTSSLVFKLDFGEEIGSSHGNQVIDRKSHIARVTGYPFMVVHIRRVPSTFLLPFSAFFGVAFFCTLVLLFLFGMFSSPSCRCFIGG